MIWLPACYGSDNLGMVDYLQVPSDLFRNSIDVVFTVVGAPGTRTRTTSYSLVWVSRLQSGCRTALVMCCAVMTLKLRCSFFTRLLQNDVSTQLLRPFIGRHQFYQVFDVCYVILIIDAHHLSSCGQIRWHWTVTFFLTIIDVVYALKHLGHALYGFGGPHIIACFYMVCQGFSDDTRRN